MKDLSRTKKIMLIASISLVVFSILFTALIIYLNHLDKMPPETPKYFTPEPETWVEQDRNSQDKEDIRINVQKATRTLSFVDENKQEYYYYGKRVVFFSHGYYKGKWFTNIYFDPSIFENVSDLTVAQQADLVDKNTLIKIYPNMNSRDGVINGFIMAKVENKTFSFYIFVDEDWKNKVNYTNIVWGSNINDPDAMHTKPFDFSNNQKGVYFEKIDYDVDWFTKEKIEGGIFVGEITKEGLLKALYELNATFIYVQ